MLSLKGIQAFPPPHNHGRDLFKRKNPNLILCKSADSTSDPPPEGDLRKQELLARIAMLQAQKLQLTEYLDETSAYLTQFAEEATVEMDQVGENALKELDEASSRIMENIESQMQAFEESAELSKKEIEENDKKLADFESQMVKERNEGLFFKSLRERSPVDKATAKEEVEKLKILTKETAESKVRRNIYLALIGVVVLGISDALINPSSDWRKVAVLGVILVGLLFQLLYEQRMLSESEETEPQESKVEKE